MKFYGIILLSFLWLFILFTSSSLFPVNHFHRLYHLPFNSESRQYVWLAGLLIFVVFSNQSTFWIIWRLMPWEISVGYLMGNERLAFDLSIRWATWAVPWPPSWLRSSGCHHSSLHDLLSQWLFVEDIQQGSWFCYLLEEQNWALIVIFFSMSSLLMPCPFLLRCEYFCYMN